MAHAVRELPLSLEREAFKANPSAPIDCFYVYPTVSLDKGGNSDMEPGPEENGVVRVQLARFASQCRLYAPMYRQATLTALGWWLARRRAAQPRRQLHIGPAERSGGASHTSLGLIPLDQMGANERHYRWEYMWHRQQRV